MAAPPNVYSSPYGILTDPDAFATPILVLALDRFGLDAIAPEEGWTPTTFKMELEELSQGEILPETIDKLMAAIAVVTTNLFWESLPHFIMLCNVLSGGDFAPQVADPADVREMSWAIVEARLLDPQPADAFSEEIQAYIAKQLQEEGFTTPPAILREAMGPHTLNDISPDLSDDPDMFEALFSKRQSDADEIGGMIRENLLALAAQLKGLVLQNGQTKEIAERIEQKLGAAAASQTRGEDA